MKKILLFPGAFNPPHNGHAEAVETVLRKESFDELWIVPSGKRDDKTIATSYEDRRAMGNLFVEYLQSKINMPVKLITAELDNMNGKFTHEILKEIKSQPDIDVMQLIGSDGFLDLQKGKLINSQEKFIVMNRNGYELPQNFSHNENIIIFEEITQSISSTQIRNMIKNNDVGYKKFVPDKIATYIENHNLYF